MRVREVLAASMFLVVGCTSNVRISVSPESVTLKAGQSYQFSAVVTGTANTAVEWAVADGAAGGSITAQGEYSAPAAPGSYEVVATSAADRTQKAAARVTVEPASTVEVAISPSEVTVGLGGFAQFVASVSGTADTGVVWSVGEATAGGAVSPNGSYRAPSTAGVFHVVATSRADPTRSATAKVTVVDQPIVTVGISPDAVALPAGQSQQFTADVAGSGNKQVLWSVREGAAGGTVSASGLYTAPAVAGRYRLLAASAADPSKVAEATITVTPVQGVVVSITPSAAAVSAGGIQQFAASVTGSANSQVTWTVQEGPAGGAIDAQGLYTAPTTAGVFHVIATSVAEATRSATATVTVTPAVVVAISPGAASVEVGKTEQFSATVTGAANTQVTWSVAEGAGGGSVDASGLYTAPASTGTFHVVATSVADASKSATATVTVTPAAVVAVSISPTTATLVAGDSQAFVANVTGSANVAVTWSIQEGAAGGAIQPTTTQSAQYTAPQSAGTYHVVVTSVADASKSAVATVTVTPAPVVVTVSPLLAYAAPGGTVQFSAAVSGSANTAVTWSVQPATGAGAVSGAGLYTAPQQAGDFAVVATSQADPTKTGIAQVRVLPAAGHTISGTVTYSGTRSGRVFVIVGSNQYGSGHNGTGLGAPGAFTIRGIRENGPLVVRAFIDVLGTGVFNAAADPSGFVNVTLPSTGSVNVVLADPVSAPPGAPSSLQGYAGDQAVMLFWSPVVDSRGQETADHYNIYWSTQPNPGPNNPASSKKTVRAGAMAYSVGHSTAAPLNSGTTYNFAVTALNGSSEGSISNIAAIPVGRPPTTGVTVSGSVNMPGLSPTGSVWFLVFHYDLVSGQTSSFVTRTGSPSQPHSFSFNNLKDGYYYVYSWLDSADDGEVQNTDLNNFESPLSFQVSGGALSGQAINFRTASSLEAVTTLHTKLGAIDSYTIELQSGANLKQPAAVTVTSGPNLAGPVDLALSSSGGSHRASIELGGTVPVAGQTYAYSIVYADGTTGTGSAQVTAVVAGMPQPTAPVTTGGTVPVFRWNAPSPAPSGNWLYDLYLFDASGRYVWYRTSVSNSRTTVTYNDDQRATQASLSVGGSYVWYLTARDEHGNRSLTQASFTAR